MTALSARFHKSAKSIRFGWNEITLILLIHKKISEPEMFSVNKLVLSCAFRNFFTDNLAKI